jgi:hypothetical protein
VSNDATEYNSVNASENKSLGLIDESDEDMNDEPYKSPENLVYETKILTSKSSQ